MNVRTGRCVTIAVEVKGEKKAAKQVFKKERNLKR
jgi:hypothetical protein